MTCRILKLFEQTLWGLVGQLTFEPCAGWRCTWQLCSSLVGSSDMNSRFPVPQLWFWDQMCIVVGIDSNDLRYCPHCSAIDGSEPHWPGGDDISRFRWQMIDWTFNFIYFHRFSNIPGGTSSFVDPNDGGGAGTCKHCKQSKQCKSSRQSEAQALTSRLSLGLKCKLSLTFECSVIDIEIIKIKLQSLTETSFNSNSVTDIIMIRVLLSGWKKDLRRQFVFWWSSGQWQRCIRVLCLSTECLLSEAAAVIVCEQGGGTRDLVANNSEHCPALGIAVVDLLTLDCFELECSKSTGHIPPIC